MQMQKGRQFITGRQGDVTITGRQSTSPQCSEEDGHMGQEPRFKMSVVSAHRSHLHRQCMEGHLKGCSKRETLFNRRGVWGQNLPQGQQNKGMKA